MNTGEDSAESPPRTQRERRRQQQSRRRIQWRSGSTSSGESSYQGNHVPHVEINEEEQQQQVQQQWWQQWHANQEQRHLRQPRQHRVEQIYRDLPRRPLQQLPIPMPYPNQDPGVRTRRANRQQQQRELRRRELQRRRDAIRNQQQNNQQQQHGNENDSDASFEELIGPGPMFERNRRY